MTQQETLSNDLSPSMVESVAGPLVSIGLPVFNGEKYLAEALDSLLAQTYPNLEIVICDNASTDRTAEICRAYAANDPRIRYVRNRTNMGASKNFTRVFELSAGTYFKWAAYDDIVAPDQIARCVEVLERESDVVACHSLTGHLDEHGHFLNDHDEKLHLRSPHPSKRFRDYLFRRTNGWNPVYGVMRADVLEKTQLIGPYMSSDQIFVAELALHGQLYQINESLFFRRYHPQMTWIAQHTPRSLTLWADMSRVHRIILPERVKLFVEYCRAIKRAQINGLEKLLCSLHMLKWLAKEVTWPFQRRWRAWRAGYNRSPQPDFNEDM